MYARTKSIPRDINHKIKAENQLFNSKEYFITPRIIIKERMSPIIPMLNGVIERKADKTTIIIGATNARSSFAP